MDMVVKVLVGLLVKLATEKFFAKVLVHSLSAWAKATENEWDNKVIEAMAEALDVPASVLKKTDA